MSTTSMFTSIHLLTIYLSPYLRDHLVITISLYHHLAFSLSPSQSRLHHLADTISPRVRSAPDGSDNHSMQFFIFHTKTLTLWPIHSQVVNIIANGDCLNNSPFLPLLTALFHSNSFNLQQRNFVPFPLVPSLKHCLSSSSPHRPLSQIRFHDQNPSTHTYSACHTVGQNQSATLQCSFSNLHPPNCISNSLTFLPLNLTRSTAHGIGAILMHLTPSHTIAQGHTGSGNKQGPPWVYVEFHLSKTKSANHRQSSMANANHQWPTPIINGQRQSSMANAKLVRINLQTSTKTDQNKSANQPNWSE